MSVPVVARPVAASLPGADAPFRAGPPRTPSRAGVPDGAPMRAAPAPRGASPHPFAPVPPAPPPTPRAAGEISRTAFHSAPDAPPAPALDTDFTALMLAIQQVSDAQIHDMLASIDDTARMNRGLIKSQLAAAERRAAALAEQQSTAAASFWLGLLGDVLLLIASALLTVVTGGAGAFLMAMAVANVALTAWDIVARIHQHRTGQDISLAAGLAAVARDVCGADEQTAREAGQWTSLVVKLVVAVGSIAGAVRSAAGAAGHVRTFTTTMHVAGTAAQLGEAGTGIHGQHHANVARHAHLDESSIRALSTVFRERLERALQALELQFGQRQEFTRGTRRNLELMHESRHIPFSHIA